MTTTAWQIAVIGAGPVGLALALHAARLLPHADITLFDARSADADVASDARTLALSLGSVQWLQQLGVWPAQHAEPILQVHVSQAAPSALTTLATLAGGSARWLPDLPAPEVLLRAEELGLPQLGAVLRYGALVAPLRQAWDAAVAAEPARLRSRYGTPVAALKAVPGGVEVDAGVAETFDLALVAEGGVTLGVDGARPGATKPATQRRALTHDYAQTAWVGEVVLEGARAGAAFERFTRHGPAALLPLGATATGERRAALVWCVPRDDDPVRELDASQRLAVLATVFPREAGRLVSVSALKSFPLSLVAERTLVRGRTVRIGNAAQTLHPVAGQGLNLGLRDVHQVVAALRWSDDLDRALGRVEWARAPDRWATIATTDFLARSFTWHAPGVATARALGLAALGAASPLRGWLARRLMYGGR